VGPDEDDMKLTCASSYALHAVVYLARDRSDAPVASDRIADALGIPDRFLLKVLKPLVDGNVLKSIKGPKGGYQLARPSAEVSVLEIVEQVDGAIDGKLPKTKMPAHPLDHKLRDICAETAEAVRATLDKFHVSDLLVARKPAARRKARGA
jgi:Rrf2 family protein